MPEELKAKLTPEFLETLHAVACQYGWNGDMIEVDKFVEWTYKQGGLPYESIEEKD